MEEKDSAFSELKPQLLLTKPKLNLPLWDKKLPKVDKTYPLCGGHMEELRQNKKAPTDAHFFKRSCLLGLCAFSDQILRENTLFAKSFNC